MKYRIGKYMCPRQIMSSDCVYIGKSTRQPGSPRVSEYDQSNNTILPFDGVTSMNAGHDHKFRVNKNRGVTIYDAVHPDLKQIKHNHHYIGKWPTGYVTRNKSSCYPCNILNPKTKKRENGAYEHSHNIQEMTRNINKI